jgi:hypothetical protein
MLDELQAIDVTAIEELRSIKAEQETLQGRLSKLEEKRGEVSDVVFERVRSDYESRSEMLEETARPLMQKARVAFASLTSLLQRMAEALDDARLSCEEIELRNELGELEKDQYEERMVQARETLERCETELGKGEALRETFLSAVRSEDDLRADEEPEHAPEPAPEPTPAEEETEPDEAEEPEESEEPASTEGPAEIGEVEAPGETGDLPEEPTAESGALDDDVTGRIDLGGVDADAAAEQAPGFDPFEPDEPVPPPVTESSEPTQMFAIARLVTSGPGGTRREHRLNPTETSIGRSPANDIRIDETSVSRRHARIVMGEDGYTIIDLESENGVFVNHERITERLLADGDIIELGPGTRPYVFHGA